MFDIFKKWYDERHEYQKKWKEINNRKIAGYICTYMPEEILYAADILPVRILGSHEAQSLTEPYLFAMYCPFCRDVLAQGLGGKYNYLDAIFGCHTCMHINQSWESWYQHVPTEKYFYVQIPSGQSLHRLPFFIKQLQIFKKYLEEWIGREITDDDLDRGIEIVNKNRRLLKAIYELRKNDNPPLTGEEAMYMVVSSQLYDKEEHNKELEKVLNALPNRKLDRQTGTRLMLIGSENDDIQFIRMLESLDCTVVIDDHCTGSRYFWNEVAKENDRIKAIAKRYLNRTPCPNKDFPEHRRFKVILDFIKDYRVDGTILIQQKFCDPHEIDIPPLKKLLEENGIPTYFLEFDVTVPIGQFKIRIEAFLEMLKAETLF